LPKLRRTLGWIFVGTVNGMVIGAILGLCFGWFTVGCNVPGNEAAGEAAIYGAILGGIIGVLTGCVCEARGRSPQRLMTVTVVVVVGSILVGLVYPSIRVITTASARMKSSGGLKQVGLALLHYHSEHGSFPPAAMPLEGEPPEKRLSWQVAILPYLARQELFDSIDKTRPWDAEENRAAIGASVFQYWNPYLVRPAPRESPGLTYYVGIAGVGPDAASLPLAHPTAGVFGYERRVTIRDITDGTSNTMMVVDTAERNGPWAAGGEAAVRGVDPSQRPYVGNGRPFGGVVKGNGGSALVLMADASVRSVQSNVKPEVFEALATIAGGEQIPLDD
jgi:hypothetical protein